MRTKDYLPRISIFIALTITYLLTVSCSEEDVIEKPIVPILENQNVTVSEDVSDEVDILTFKATDDDTDASELIYSIIQNSNNLFELTMDGSNAIITLIEDGELDYETTTSHEITVEISDGENKTTAKITITVTDIDDTISATAATFGTSVSLVSNSYDFSTAIEIDVTDYNEDFTYELKLTGVYFKEEYTISLTEKSDEVGGGELIKDKAGKTALVVIPNASSEATTILEADAEDIDLETDVYDIVLVEKESKNEISITGGEDDEIYTVIDKNATTFLSGTRIESNSWAILSELDLNSHSVFRVRPTITNYINGIALVLGVYDIDANKIGYITSSGSNGSGSGTYSYKFSAVKLNELITEDGDYLLRLEERTSTIDENDTGYRNALLQKIKITKVSENTIEDSESAGVVELKKL